LRQTVVIMTADRKLRHANVELQIGQLSSEVRQVKVMANDVGR
jgi:hypothetical protein